MSSQPSSKRGDFNLIGSGSLWDGVAYWCIIIGVYVMVGGLMFYSGKEKLFDDNGKAPEGIKQQFANSFLSTFPGTNAAWVILGILEFAVFALLVLSVISGEFFPHRHKHVMQVALSVALITFAFLAFGQTSTGQFSGTASLYQYFGATVVILILVSMLPPNRPDRWLRSDIQP
ncbi:MAG TPA: hypothetical protein VGQ38_08260 [Gaiellaceae bacterium]|jgi:hypothetical protein|nr:hypothetical protein [Gaiellaceae bacterium]